MFQQVPSLNWDNLKRRSFLVLVLMLSFMVDSIKSAVIETNDPKFIAGYKSLFVNSLTTFPDSITYPITYSQTLSQPSTFYELVISINTFQFMQSNIIGWNFTKQNITVSRFKLIYEAGINSVIYTLAINYMLVDNGYPDYEIAYYSQKSAIMSQGIGFRSENISYTSKKFTNDSNYVSIVVFESFNLSNTENDNVVLKHNTYQKNLTVIVEIYTVGLTIVHDFQLYFILYNMAYMVDTMNRRVFVSTESLTTVGVGGTTLSLPINDGFRKRERLFAGISGLNLTRSSNRSFEFKFYINEVYDFQLNSSGVKSIDLSILSAYDVSCPFGTYYRPIDNNCLVSCPASQYPDITHTTAFCRGCHYSCSSCWDEKETSCKSCFSTINRDPVVTGLNAGNLWYSCYCKVGYFDVFQGNCETCAMYLPGCAKCANNATCLQCKVGLKLINNKCICNNPAFFYSLSDNDCISRIIGCQTHTYDGSSLICTECYVQRNFTLNSSLKCQCQQPLYQIAIDMNSTGEYWCNYICGDGYVGLGEPCDDNNTVSGDGCSSVCQVETNFVCANTTNMPSVCEYNFSVELIFHTAERVMYENTVVLNFTFQPSVYFMSSISNWTALVHTDLPNQKIEDDFKCPDILNNGRCNLTLTVQYTALLQEETFWIYLSLSSHPMIKYDSRKLYFSPTGQIASLTYEPESHLNMIEAVHIMVLVLVILGMVIFLISIYFQKMVGVQLIVTLQYVYYLLTPINHNPIQLVPFQQNMKYTTGFNQIYNYTYFRYAPIPTYLNHQYYEKEFLMNFNVMLLLLVVVMFLLIGVKIFKTFQDRLNDKPKKEEIFQNAQQIKRIKKFDMYYSLYWNKIFFVYVFFVMYQVLFGCAITTLTELPAQDIFSSSLNFLAMFVSLFIIMVVGELSVGYWFYQGNRKKGSISLSENQVIPYQFKICTKTYIMIFSIIQPIKIWIIAIFFQESYCYFLTLAIEVIYFTVLVILRPYKRNDEQDSNLTQNDDQNAQYNTCMSIHNFGICFNQLCLIIANILYLVWNLKCRDAGLYQDYPQLMLFTSITLVFLVEVVAILRLLYKKIGAVLFCDYFKRKNPNAITFENAYAKMRKIIRDDDLRALNEINQTNQSNNEDIEKYKKDRMKILQQLKKSKQFAIDWKDDPKPKYFYNQYKGSDSDGDEEDSPQRDKTVIMQNKETADPVDISYFTDGKTSRVYKNPGIVEMETLNRSMAQSSYKVSRSTQKKVANLSRSILDLMLEKKDLENSSQRKNRGHSSGYDFDSSEKNKKDMSELEEIKNRMRKLNTKNSQIKESFLQDQQ